MPRAASSTPALRRNQVRNLSSNLVHALISIEIGLSSVSKEKAGMDVPLRYDTFDEYSKYCVIIRNVMLQDHIVANVLSIG